MKVRYITGIAICTAYLSVGCQRDPAPSIPKPSTIEEAPEGDTERGPGESDGINKIPAVPSFGAKIGTEAEIRAVEECIRTGYFYRRTAASADSYATQVGITENAGCSKVEKIAAFPCTEESLLINPQIKAELRTPAATDKNGLRYLFQDFKNRGFQFDQCSVFPYKIGNTNFTFRIYFAKEEKNAGTTTVTVDSIRIPK